MTFLFLTQWLTRCHHSPKKESTCDQNPQKRIQRGQKSPKNIPKRIEVGPKSQVWRFLPLRRLGSPGLGHLFPPPSWDPGQASGKHHIGYSFCIPCIWTNYIAKVWSILWFLFVGSLIITCIINPRYTSFNHPIGLQEFGTDGSTFFRAPCCTVPQKSWCCIRMKKSFSEYISGYFAY